MKLASNLSFADAAIFTHQVEVKQNCW